MEPLMFVMAILGCGESDASCRELGVIRARFPTEAACLAATEDVLARQDSLIYPNVVAQCRRTGAQRQLLRGSDVRMPPPGRLPMPAQRIAARRGQAGVS